MQNILQDTTSTHNFELPRLSCMMIRPPSPPLVCWDVPSQPSTQDAEPPRPSSSLICGDGSLSSLPVPLVCDNVLAWPSAQPRWRPGCHSSLQRRPLNDSGYVPVAVAAALRRKMWQPVSGADVTESLVRCPVTITMGIVTRPLRREGEGGEGGAGRGPLAARLGVLHVVRSATF